MTSKFDQQKAKHQLLHVSITLMTILLCLTYAQSAKSWQNIGKLWESLIIPFILTGELAKLALSKYFGRYEKDIITIRQKKKSYMSSYREVLGGLCLQGVCTLLYAFTCIILGAPVLQSYEQTFILSLMLSLLTVSPTILLVGVSRALQVVFCEKPEFLIKSEETSLELYKYNAAGAIFGAWTGSVVAPLDWDRDWQAYPVPNVIGALLGCGLANIYICSKVLFTTGKLYLNKKRV